MSNKELKVKSFRVDEETFSKFKEIAATEYGNQGQCLDALINLYEIEQSKSSLVARELEIESFQDYINKINRLFVTSLQLSEDAEARAKESFIKKIEAKDEALIVLKNKLELKKKDETELKSKITSLLEEQTKLKDEVRNLEESKSTLSQLANRNFDLSEELKSKIAKLEKTLDEEKINYDELLNRKQEILTLRNENSELKKCLGESEEKTKVLENLVEVSNEKIKSLKDEKKSYNLLIDRLKVEHRVEVDSVESRYEEKYKKELENRLELLEREHNLEIKELEFKIKTLEK